MLFGVIACVGCVDCVQVADPPQPARNQHNPTHVITPNRFVQCLLKMSEQRPKHVEALTLNKINQIQCIKLVLIH
jgi:hypothetical protein